MVGYVWLRCQGLPVTSPICVGSGRKGSGSGCVEMVMLRCAVLRGTAPPTGHFAHRRLCLACGLDHCGQGWMERGCSGRAGSGFPQFPKVAHQRRKGPLAAARSAMMPGPPGPATYPLGVPGNPLWTEGAASGPGATPWVLSTLPGAACERPLCLDYGGQVPALIGGVCFLLFFCCCQSPVSFRTGSDT